MHMPTRIVTVPNHLEGFTRLSKMFEGISKIAYEKSVGAEQGDRWGQSGGDRTTETERNSRDRQEP